MDASQLRVLPHDLNAEVAILGGLLINPKADAYNLDPDAFYRQAHAVIYKAICDCKVNGETVDVVTVTNRLGKSINSIGGIKYLAHIIDSVGTSAGIKSHIKILNKLHQQRRIISLCSDISGSAFQTNSDPEELLSRLTGSIRDIQFQDKTYVDGVDISNVYDATRMLEEYSQYIQTLQHNRFITGIPEIDRRIRGVGGGEVLTIIARAGSFKTAVLQNFLKGYVDNSKWGAIFFSLEMPVASMTERYSEIIYGSTGRDIEQIYSDGKASGLRKSIECDFINGMKNLFIIPTKVSIQDMAQYIALIEREYKIKIGVIGIDYLGLIEGEGRGEYEIISGIARNIKLLAKRINLPTILLSQVSRKGGSGEEEVYLEYGRGSGAIEESADFVLGFWQAKRNMSLTDSYEEADQQYDLICKILKNRKGPKNSIWKLDINPSNLRLGKKAVKYEPPKVKRDDGY